MYEEEKDRTNLLGILSSIALTHNAAESDLAKECITLILENLKKEVGAK